MQQMLDYATRYYPSPIVLLWFLSATAYYVAAAIVGPLHSDRPTLLFSEMYEFAPWLPVVWGLIGLASIVMEFVGVYLNIRLFTRLFSMIQVVLWVFAGGLYIIGGYIMLLFAVALPHIGFWAWNQAVRYDHNRIVKEVRSGFKESA